MAKTSEIARRASKQNNDNQRIVSRTRPGYKGVSRVVLVSAIFDSGLHPSLSIQACMFLFNQLNKRIQEVTIELAQRLCSLMASRQPDCRVKLNHDMSHASRISHRSATLRSQTHERARKPHGCLSPSPATWAACVIMNHTKIPFLAFYVTVPGYHYNAEGKNSLEEIGAHTPCARAPGPICLLSRTRTSARRPR